MGAFPAAERAATTAAIAKATLRRLAERRLEPTPDNYARAWAEEVGEPPPGAEARRHGPAWADLIGRLTRGLERGGAQWTRARRRDSLERVLGGSRSDAERLLQRLQSLVQAWEGDAAAEQPEVAPAVEPGAVAASACASAPAPAATAWPDVLAPLQAALGSALPADDARAAALADELASLAAALADEGPTPPLVAALDALCATAARWFGHRHQTVAALAALCRELTRGLTELAEDDSWARGQAAEIEARLGDGLNLRTLHAAGAALAQARERQQALRDERAAARDALKTLLARMLGEVGALGSHTGSFESALGRHAEAIASASSLEGLTDVVQALLADSRSVQAAVRASQQRLDADRERAEQLESRVRELEAELRRISDDAATDALTQVANRRGLERAFAAEAGRCERDAAATLAVALIDIDNFKKLNDRLGHAAGDQALKSLAAAVRERLRPVDHVARFGGEEFVLLLPGSAAAEAQQALTRLQRSLSASLFLHEGEEVFVTFSAGVTAWRAGETLDAALARADEALYEAKRTGKNRTCIA
jgi:diguanylate cyclase